MEEDPAYTLPDMALHVVRQVSNIDTNINEATRMAV